MKNIIFSTKDIVKVSNKEVEWLKRIVLKNQKAKMRLCLHKNTSDSLHEMIIVCHKGTYIRPHKHKNKTEAFHILRGKILLIIFDNRGKVIEKIFLGGMRKGSCFLCRVQKKCWHMLIPVSKIAVFLETTNGPYVSKNNSIFAPWSPDGSDSIENKEFVKRIFRK